MIYLFLLSAIGLPAFLPVETQPTHACLLQYGLALASVHQSQARTHISLPKLCTNKLFPSFETAIKIEDMIAQMYVCALQLLFCCKLLVLWPQPNVGMLRLHYMVQQLGD